MIAILKFIGTLVLFMGALAVMTGLVMVAQICVEMGCG